MVKTYSGFSLVEVIISIIIIAITSVSVPVMIAVTSEANKRSIAQEVIFNTKTHMNLILKAPYACISGLSLSLPSGSVYPMFVSHNNTPPDTSGMIQLNAFGYDNRNNIVKDFYSLHSLDSTGRRLFVYYENRALSTLPTTSTTSKKCIDDFAINSRQNISYDNSNAKRDFISEYSIDSVAVDNLSYVFGLEGFDKKRNRSLNLDKDRATNSNYFRFDTKRVSITVTPKALGKTIKIVGFASNIGDSPIIQTRTW